MKNIKEEKTTYTLLANEDKVPPKIIFDKSAIKWFELLAELHPVEVGCWAFVDQKNTNTYFVRDVFYPMHQLMTSGTCEISPEGNARLANWLFDHNRADDVPKCRCWGHSHHNMGVGASSQDESQAIELMNSNKGFLIRCIFNKEKEMSVSFFDYDKKIKFDNIKWTVSSWSMADKSIKIPSIKSIIDSDADDDHKLSLILSTILSDVESDKIREKIKQLMEINVPKEPTISTRPPSRGSFVNDGALFPTNSEQTNLFDRTIYSPDNTFNELYGGIPYNGNSTKLPEVPESLSNSAIFDLTNDPEINKMIEQIGKIK